MCTVRAVARVVTAAAITRRREGVSSDPLALCCAVFRAVKPMLAAIQNHRASSTIHHVSLESQDFGEI
jgi:hypothetical protein